MSFLVRVEVLLSTTTYDNSIVMRAKVYIPKNKEKGWLALRTGAHLSTGELAGGGGSLTPISLTHLFKHCIAKTPHGPAPYQLPLGSDPASSVVQFARNH